MFRVVNLYPPLKKQQSAFFTVTSYSKVVALLQLIAISYNHIIC